ncbi:Cadherin EGF LAG seven-pass G-type receptor 1 [Acipenser ruthenus]|uniref:Cadherin EGF LAG seven-pass G-type receptor 1 n=1 Tax=Acipenser ruthenus TaxID=7906 RepID=A0A444TYJ5_ACIRT|nr:Cadherin EGF LAG seven-pass G-type receptor 1 [Acipenser ruthenus]
MASSAMASEQPWMPYIFYRQAMLPLALNLSNLFILTDLFSPVMVQLSLSEIMCADNCDASVMLIGRWDILRFDENRKYGIHQVTALCTLRVTIITDDMLTNSITVRLENMSQEKFLSPLLSLFVEGVAAVLSTTKDGIFIFNIQNDTDVHTNILNVTFSALLPGGLRNQYFPSEDLQEQIYLNRTLLTMISTQRVLPFDDNICLREPCENYMKCISVLKFDSSAPFITSNTVLFRPIHPINGLRCRCPPGFTGDYCETEIDLCYSSPCNNNGRCKSREGGYSCECPEDFTGEHCEVNTRSGRCSPGVCKNGGTCINLLIGGFRCECPPGEYERPYCEMTTRSFPPQSFVTFKGLRQRFHFTVSLMFATRERNALLLYNGRFNEKHDFIAVEIIDEQIQLTFSAGEAITTVAPLVPSGVSDGQWHSVQVHYYNKFTFRSPDLYGDKAYFWQQYKRTTYIQHVWFAFWDGVLKPQIAEHAGIQFFYSQMHPSPGMPSPQHFEGHGMVSWSMPDITISVPWYIGLMFRTRKSNGMLMQAKAGSSSKITILISNSNVQFELHRGFTQMANFKFTQIRVNDGDWHHLLIELKNVKDGKDMKLLALMSLDYGMYQGSVEIEKELPGMTLESLFLGGLLGDDGKIEQGFVGCMQGVRLGETATNVATLNMNQGKKIRVQNGCDVSDPCDSNTCPEHSHCSDDWKTHSCVCDPGYFGKDCVDVCRLNPCEHASACVRKPSSSHGYTCECGQNYYGHYCENKINQPCPRGWWGNSICGPCNCDTDKGFDPDCNKTSGECRCKANHYRPQGSDSCFPCDCFSLGAHTRTCDDETGQCQCKTGVIGRQCNRCDNPFAEVTSNGCQVIYEGCPKSFEAGIWWPKTKFGRPAAMNCPKGSVGTAVRHCSEIKGWLPPELFNCTTLTFSELKTMNEKMHRNETNMAGDKSMNIAELLQNATMHTDVFYGNDVKTAYQLISQVLEYESKQQGFDLAATRDAEFNENIIKAGSAILDPSNKEHWEQIQRTEGGTAHLLKSYEEYANNMAQNMRKTYLKPFTIVTPNMIVALDFLDDSNPESAKIPRFEEIREEYPKDLESTVKFPGAIFRPQEPKVNPTDQPLEPSDSPEVSEASAKRKRRHPEKVNPHVVAVVMVYRSMGQLLPEQYDPDRRSLRLPNRPVINTPIVSTTVHSEEGTLPTLLKEPITLYYNLLETEERTKPVCVFWNHSIPIGGTGGWSSKGCELVFRNETHISCQCNHMTSFAVLMDISKREHGEVLPLKIVTYTTVSVSLVALLVTFILLVIIRTLRSNLHSIHKNLVAALFFSELVFLIGINQTDNPFVCTVIAILLHYFYMCTFAWMFVEGLHIYRMLTEVRNINHGHMRFYYAIGWGIPAVITGLAVGLDPQGYGNPDFCWLSVYDTLIWSFAGPISLVVLVNIVIFVLAARASCGRKNRTFEKAGVISSLRTAFLLLLLISATWLLGLMTVNSNVMTFHYLFAIFSCLQRSLNCNNTYIEEPDMYRTTIGESTASLDSTVRSAKSHSSYLAYKFRKDATQKPSISSSIARLEQTEGDSAKFHRNPTKTEDHDSDSDSELSVDEHSSSYASSHSSDSEDDDTQLKPKWNPTTPKNNERQPLHSTPKGILKNKITYPPPLTDKNMTNRLREKLSDYNPPTIPSRTSSIGSNDGTRSAPGTGVLIKQPHRQQSREQQNGVAMNVRVGIVNGDTSDSDVSSSQADHLLSQSNKILIAAYQIRFVMMFKRINLVL